MDSNFGKENSEPKGQELNLHPKTSIENETKNTNNENKETNIIMDKKGYEDKNKNETKMEDKEGDKEEDKEEGKKEGKEKDKKEDKEEYENDDEREKKNLEKFRINYLSFETSQPKTDLKTVCPICSSIPDINLSRNSEKGHYVKCLKCRYCYCCSHPRSKTLDDYISIMAKIQQDNLKCQIHQEKGIEVEAFFSCELCRKWMCEECINRHLEEKQKVNENHYYYIIRKYLKNLTSNTICLKHNLEYSYYELMEMSIGFHLCKKCEFSDDPESDIMTINKKKGECYFNQLKQVIKNGVEYLDIYCNNIYNHLMNSLKDNQELMKKAKEIYDKFLISNRRALFYFQMLINTGTPLLTNYNLIGNISNALNVKFEKIKIKLSDELNQDQIDQILNFFEYNYIVGKYEQSLNELKDKIDIKELYTIKKEIKVKKEEQKKEGDEEKEKINYIDILIFSDNIILAGTENGDIHLFEISNFTSEGKFLLSQKLHDNGIISLDKIKNSNNKFVTCDEKEIKIWILKKEQDNYIINCETTLKDFSESKLTFLYVLNDSNNIGFINRGNRVIILGKLYKPFFNVHFDTDRLKGLYQIESNDENNKILIIGGSSNIILYKIADKINYIGFFDLECFSGKSFCYLGNDILLIGGDDNIYIVNIKKIKLEQIIKIRNAECTCFLKYNDLVLCGYGDTSGCSYWSNGIAQTKETKFMILEKNNEKFEYHFIEDEFCESGITNALWVEEDKFISYFYNDDSLKIFQLK